MKEIYIKAENFFIEKVLELARINLGKAVRIIDLNPELVQEADKEVKA